MSASILRLFVFALLLIASAVAPEARACEPVTSVPASLSNGSYCLDFDVGIGGASFSLGDDVVLDCRGHSIRDLSLTYSAIYLEGSNAVVKNCTFEGFESAITVLSTAQYFRILNNVVIEPKNHAVNSFGSSGLIAGNRISSKSSMSHQWMIKTNGSVDIVDNLILNEGAPVTTEYGARYGVSSSNNSGGLIARNILRNVAPAAGEQGIAIHASQGYPVIYRNILSAEPGKGDIGMFCSGGDALALLNVVVGYPHTVGYCQ